ncbi:MAG: hypothetical protein ACI84O_001126 [Myxococcota bacterium]|jgi:hypothetical protein
MLKRPSLVASISLITSALVAASSAFEIKVPDFIVNSALQEISPQLHLDTAEIHFTWRNGQISISSLTINNAEKQVATLINGKLHIGVNPAKSSFLQPVLVLLNKAKLDLDEQLYAAIAKLEASDQPPSSLRLDVYDSSVHYYSDDGNDYKLQNINANVLLNSKLGILNFSCDSTSPTVGRIEAKAHTANANQQWHLWTKLDGTVLEDWPWFDSAKLNFKPSSIRAELKANGNWEGIREWRLTSDIELNEPRLSAPILSFDESLIHFEGSSASGIYIQAETSLFESTVRTSGELSFDDHEGLHLQLVHTAHDFNVDRRMHLWLKEIEPGIETYLSATQAAGSVSAQVLTAVDNGEFVWAISILPKDLNVSYRGLSGDINTHFSFPYPVRLNEGYIVVADGGLLFNSNGDIGDGQVSLRGDIDFRPVNTSVDLSINIDRLSLGQRISNALSGNPQIGKLWRGLGSPDGGHANADIRLFADNNAFDYAVALNLYEFEARPSLLPLDVYVDYAKVNITPNVTTFTADATAANSKLKIHGSAHNFNNGKDSQLRVNADGVGWKPDERQALVLSSYLPIPSFLTGSPIDGDFSYKINLLWPNTELQPQMATELFATDTSLEWPQLGIQLSNLHANNTQFFTHADDFIFHAGELNANAGGGRINAQSSLSHYPNLNSVTVDLQQLPITDKLISGSQEFTEQQAWGTHLNWNGAINGYVSLNPFQPENFISTIDLSPLLVSVKQKGNEVFELRGAIDLHSNTVHADKLEVTSPRSALLIQNIKGYFDDEGLHAAAVLESNIGIQLQSDLPLLAGSDVAQTLERLGLEGELFADSLEVEALLNRDGRISADFGGGMTIERLNISNGIPISGGMAEIDVKSAWWNSASDFGAQISLHKGSGRLASMNISEVQANVTIDAKQLLFENLQAKLLDGNIGGEFAIGFSETTPVNLDCLLDNIDLGEMRNALKIRGALSGRVSGDVKLNSPSLSPTFSKGSVNLKIRDGVLGSTPVLKNIWRISGLIPPIIDNGNISFEMLGNGQIHIKDFSLDGAAFEFTGKGWANMDSTVSLKVTMRTLSLITRLPLIKDLLDLFIEQQVYGPIDDLQIVHRGWAFIAGSKDFLRPPFPLWVPAPAAPDWSISPVIPLQ